MRKRRLEVVRTAAVLIGIVLLGIWTGRVLAFTPASGMFPFANLESSRMVYIELPDRMSFREVRGDQFHVDMGPDAIPMQLTLIQNISLNDNTFLLRFRSLDQRKLANDTYLLEHQLLGPMPIFLTHNPVSGDVYLERFLLGGEQEEARKKIYEAIINLPPE